MDAASDLRKRGYNLEDPVSNITEPTFIDGLQMTGIATWKQARSDQLTESSLRTRVWLQKFQHQVNDEE